MIRRPSCSDRDPGAYSQAHFDDSGLAVENAISNCSYLEHSNSWNARLKVAVEKTSVLGSRASDRSKDGGV